MEHIKFKNLITDLETQIQKRDQAIFREIRTQAAQVNSFTDDIIENLNDGSEVEMIILRSNKKRKSGFAYILGVTN